MIFDGGKTMRTATVTPKEFANIYNDYGYGRTLACDTASLSYAAQMTPHLRLIAIDACKYDQNDFGKNTCVTSGRIKPATLLFIQQQTAAAKKAGCKVIAMMHHGVVPHFAAQPAIFPEYLVNNYSQVGRKLYDAGIRVVFTGHFHSQEISRDSTVTDVKTGSTVSYPHPYRIIAMDDDKMTIATKELKTLTSMKSDGEDLDRKSERFARLSVSKIAEGYLPQATPKELRTSISHLLGDAYIMHLAGDEHPSDAFLEEKAEVIQTVNGISPELAHKLDGIVTSLSMDLPPMDNQVVINY